MVFGLFSKEKSLQKTIERATNKLAQQPDRWTALEKLKEDGQEAEALGNLEKQITQTEKQLAEARARQAGNVPLMVYGDILWGLFNSTEFAFNH